VERERSNHSSLHYISLLRSRLPARSVLTIPRLADSPLNFEIQMFRSSADCVHRPLLNGNVDLFPGKPDRPVAVRVEGTSVSLEWAEPDDSGGHVITGYVIKFGVADSNQYETKDVDIATASHTLAGVLHPQTPYVFAVAAKTAAGQGPFSDLSDPVQNYRG